MLVSLHSQSHSATINSLGAELISLRDKENIEYVWQAEKDVWARHAPVLFPIVGKLKDDAFFFGEKTFHLSQHGFARDMEFELASKENNSCVFSLSSNSETKKKFPFDFNLEIKYRLHDNNLTTHYTVKNPSETELLFSIGAHPGFNCPLLAEESFEDYYLEFEDSDFKLSHLDNGLLNGYITDFKLSDRKLQLSATLFDNDALVFENSQINSIALCSSKSSRKIKMECKNWPFFGIWSKKGNRKFICLEPWHGIADTNNSDQQLIHKKGIVSLKPSKEFNCHFSVSFH